MTIAGFWLQIDGFPYLFGTKDLPALVPTTFAPSDDAPTGAGAMPGRLDWPTGSIDEQIEPVRGSLRAGSMTFSLVDDPADPVLDESLSIDPRRVTTATIASSITATDTTIALNTTVPSSITGLSYPAVVWIDEEAILVDSYSSPNLVNCTRGYYGTRASAHRVDTELGQYPEVWPVFPFGTGRRVILWAVDDSDFTTATAVWRGYLRAPRLARNGAGYELPCEHLSTWELQRPIGGLTYSVRLRGYSSAAVSFAFNIPNGYDGTSGDQKVSTFHGWADDEGVARGTIDEFLTWSREKLAERLLGTTLALRPKTAQTSVNVRMDRTGADVYFEAGADDTGAGVISATEVVQPAVSVSILGQEFTAPAPNRTGGIYRGGITVSFPQCALAGRSDRALPLPVERLDGLPSTFPTATTYGDGPFATRIRAVLTAPYDDSTRLLVLPESSTGGDASVGGSPSVTGTVRYVPLKSGSMGASSRLQRVIYERRGVSAEGYAIRRDTGATRAWIDRPLNLAYSQWVSTDHWVYGLRRALEDDDVSSGSDSRNWEWSYADSVARATAGDLSSREWFLDGARTVRELLGDTLSLDGCALSTGPYGRLRIVPVRPALQHRPTGEFAAEIDCIPSSVSTRVSIVKDTVPQWSALADALTNVVSLSTDALDVTVRDVRSFQRYGQRATLELKVEGLPLDRRTGEDPRAIAQRVLQRITGLWSEPVFQVVVTIPASDKSGNPLGYGTTGIYPGSYVILRNGYNLPNGDGARGLDLRGVFVAGRRWNLASNTIDVTCWLLREVWAYTPCVKAASIVAATGVVTADVRFVRRQHNQSTDYCGGYRSGSVDTGALGKGGVGGFAAGGKVRLVTRDTLTPSQETYTIASVDTTNGTITMTGAIATAPYNWPTLAANGWVDVIDATFTTTPNNTYYAWVGNGTAAEGVIGGSTTQSREFAP